MKVQDVKKECLATVGLSLEFSNSEVACIDRLLWSVDDAIDKAINQKIAELKSNNAPKEIDFEDDVNVTIDLRSLKKIQWLLYQMTRTNRCDLFNEANREYETEIVSINNTVSNSFGACTPKK